MSPRMSLMQLMKQLRQENASESERKRRMDAFFSEKALENGIPFSGGFELTPFCNLDCRMCYVHLNADTLGSERPLSAEEWKRIFLEAKKAGMMRATLTGGECLLHPAFDELYLYLRDLGIEISIYTNGVLLNEPRIEFLKKYPPRFIQISLYGASEETYLRVTGKPLFGTVYANILNAKEAGLPLRIMITPNAHMADAAEIIKLARENDILYSINRALIEPREETQRTVGPIRDILALQLEIFKQDCALQGRILTPVSPDSLPAIGGDHHISNECGLECHAGGNSFHMNWKGEMMPCINFDSICSYPLRDGFTASWRHLHEAVKMVPRIPECRGCAYEELCDKCPGHLAKLSGPGKQCMPWCEHIRSMVQQGIGRLPNEDD